MMKGFQSFRRWKMDEIKSAPTRPHQPERRAAAAERFAGVGKSRSNMSAACTSIFRDAKRAYYFEHSDQGRHHHIQRQRREHDV